MQQDDSFPRAQICKPRNCGASLQFVMALYQSSASVSKLISALNGYSSKYDVGQRMRMCFFRDYTYLELGLELLWCYKKFEKTMNL